MRDDDEPRSGHKILWYEVGRSSGYGDGEFDGYRSGQSAGFANAQRAFQIREENDRRAGLAKYPVQAINELEANRDSLWKQGNLLARLVDASAERIEFLEADVKTLEGYLAVSKQQTTDAKASHRKTENYNRSMNQSLRALLKAAEQGRTHYPEYQELKSLIDQMIVAWGRGKDICTPDGIGPRVAAAVKVLDP